MNKINGYAGMILKIDLTTESISKIPLTEELITKFLGGAGINARLAYDHIEPDAEPLSPQNALILGAGPLVGTLTPGAGKTNITAKSPSSRFIGSSGSGHMGMLKFAGYDHVIITGKADRPVYLKIGDEVEIKDARHIWGKDTWETTDAVWHELGRQYAVLGIGPAGENLVRDASIIANKYSAFARTGMGAVMGSKNLKAIAVFGNHGISVANPKKFISIVNKLCREIPKLQDDNFRKYGKGLAHLEGVIKTGGLAYKNFRNTAGPELLEVFDIDKLLGAIERSRRSCFSCPVGCKHYMLGKEGGELAGLALPISCGLNPIITAINCGVTGWPEVLKFAEMSNRLGMDQISISGIVAMAIELYEKEIITKADTDGLKLGWNSETFFRLVHDIAYRRGIGNILANGLKEASQQIGKGAEYYAIHFKGIGGIESRIFLSAFLLGALTNATGHFSNIMFFKTAGDELVRYCKKIGMTEKEIESVSSGPDGYNVPRMTKWADDHSFVLECLGICMHYIYQEFDISLWADLYSAATGINIDAQGLFQAAARGRDMRKAFNMREGATRKDDGVPKRFLSEPVQFGGKMYPPLNSSNLDALLTEYYEERGWDSNEGTLSTERLEELTLP